MGRVAGVAARRNIESKSDRRGDWSNRRPGVCRGDGPWNEGRYEAIGDCDLVDGDGFVLVGASALSSALMDAGDAGLRAVVDDGARWIDFWSAQRGKPGICRNSP